MSFATVFHSIRILPMPFGTIRSWSVRCSSGQKHSRRCSFTLVKVRRSSETLSTASVGAKIVYDRVSDAYDALEQIAADPRIEIVSFDDRFAHPEPSGYRDLQMKVRMPNGHIAELRVHLSHVDEIATHEHAMYEV